MKKVISHKIEADIDDHVFIMIERPGRPTVSLDFMNHHGRAGIGVRVNGMGIGNILCDVKELPPESKLPLARYCPMCGEKLQLFSSRPHACKEDYE